jgi:hypothetical protein
MDNTYNQKWTPTCYFDGGYQVLIGGGSSPDPYTSRIEWSGRREVPELELDISMTFIDNRNIEYTITLTNNNFVNFAPDTPPAPTGPDTAVALDEYNYTATATDPDADQLYYMWDWSGDVSGWMGPYDSGVPADAAYTWTTAGTHDVKVKVKDQWNEESLWSDPFTVTVVERGDPNGDGDVNVADAVYLISYIFKGGPPPNPLEAGDANCDGDVNIGDAVHLINYIFKGGPPPGCP